MIPKANRQIAKSTKQKFSLRLKKEAQVIEYSPTLELTDKDFIIRAICDCLKDNDLGGAIEIIEAHLEALNKLQFPKC